MFGRKVIEPGVKEAGVIHNSQYKEFFSSAMVKFKNSQGEPVVNPFFWCSKLKDFLTCVADKRGKKLEDCTLKLGADSGKGFFKLTASIYIPPLTSQLSTKKLEEVERMVSAVKDSLRQDRERYFFLPGVKTFQSQQKILK